MPALIRSTTRRDHGRTVPVPGWARNTAVLLLGAELLGFVLRVSGAPTAVSHPFSMDQPYSAPRLLTAAVFTTAAGAAAAGAVRLERRRSWWTAIAVLCASVAVVKAGSTLHKQAVQAIGGYDHPLRALAVSAAVATLVLSWLFWLSREDRRDRRRVLRWLGLYAVAAGGLSTVSATLESALGHGSAVAAASTLVEESGEALSAVGLLVAVLVGVAPRLVFPEGHPFRRADDRTTPAPDLRGISSAAQ